MRRVRLYLLTEVRKKSWASKFLSARVFDSVYWSWDRQYVATGAAWGAAAAIAPLPMQSLWGVFACLWRKGNIPQILSYTSGALGILFLLAAIANFIWGFVDRKYAVIAWVVGLSWFIVPVVWISRHKHGLKFLSAGYWIAGWLIPCWLALAFAGDFGLLGDYNPDFRIFFQQPAIASILQNHPINFVQVHDKNSVLLNFYTPVHGQKLDTIAQLPPYSYAWVDKNHSPEISRPHRLIGEVRNYELIQVTP